MWAGFGIAMMLGVQAMNDLIIFHSYSNVEQMIDEHNVALACVEAGVYVGFSYIIAACIHAENVALAFTFFFLSTVIMVGFSFGYEYLTKYDDREAIQAKNVASGINWGLNMVAFGLLLSRSIYTSNSIWVFLAWGALGGAAIVSFRKLFDRVIIPEIGLDNVTRIDEGYRAGRGPASNNWGVAGMAGVMTISIVQCLNSFLRDCEFEFVG